MIWVSGDGIEAAFVVVYCPTEGEHELADRIWQWVQKALEKIPARVVTIVMTDANGHAGSVREREVEEDEVAARMRT